MGVRSVGLVNLTIGAAGFNLFICNIVLAFNITTVLLHCNFLMNFCISYIPRMSMHSLINMQI